MSLTAGVVEPRYPSFKGIRAAKSKPIVTKTVADLDVSIDHTDGVQQHVLSITPTAQTEAGEIVTDDGEAHAHIVSYLEQQSIL